MVKIDLRPSSVSLYFTKCKANTDEINSSNDDTRMIEGTIQVSGKASDAPEEKRVEVLKDAFGCLQDMFGKESFVMDDIRLDEAHRQLHFDFVPVENEGPVATTMISCDRLEQCRDGILNRLQDKYPYLNFQYCTCQADGPLLDDIEDESDDVEDEPDDVEDGLDDVEDEPDDVEDESDDVEDEPDDDSDDVEDESDDVEDDSDVVEDELDRKHDDESGQNHQSLTEPIAYWKIAEEMTNDVMLISDHDKSQKERLSAVSRLRENLDRCAADKNLDKLTAIYRDTMPTTKVNVGYDQVAVSEFIIIFGHRYPKPDSLKLDDAVPHDENAVSDHESAVNQADAQITESQKMDRLELRMMKMENALKDRELKDREMLLKDKKTWLKDREDLIAFRDLYLEFRDLCLGFRENDLMSRELCLRFDKCDLESHNRSLEYDKKSLKYDKDSLKYNKRSLDSNKVILELDKRGFERDKDSLKRDKEWLERDKRDLKPREDELNKQEASRVRQMMDELDRQDASKVDSEFSKAYSELRQMMDE